MMTGLQSYLPPNSTAFERAFETALHKQAEVAENLSDLWSPERCPELFLPWLAWTLSVDVWDPGWTIERQRTVIAKSVEVHRLKGTVSSIKEALRAAGFNEIAIIENYGRERRDARHLRDGSFRYIRPDHWAEYRVKLNRPITLGQAAAVRVMLSAIAPARARLKVLDYRTASHIHNRTLARNGQHTRGTV